MMLYIARSGERFASGPSSTLLRLSRKPPPSIRVDGGGRLKRIVHEQFLVLFFDEARAVRTLPALRPDDGTHRAGVVELIRDGVGLVGGLPLATVTERFWMVEEMFDPPGAEPSAASGLSRDGAGNGLEGRRGECPGWKAGRLLGPFWLPQARRCCSAAPQ